MKITHWQTALHARAQELLGTPFKYSQTDCNLVCLMMHDAMTGLNVADKYRGLWSDRKTAVEYMQRTGTNIESVIRGLGGIPVPVGFQQEGDFILTTTADGWLRGHTCLGEMTISSDRDNGVSLYPTQAILTLKDHTHLVLRIPAW